VLRVYTRHYSPCKQTDGSYRRCHCPKWINGLLPTGEFLRVSAKTRSWETAERKARLREANADPLRQSPPDASLTTTIEAAVRAFLQDEEARQLAKTTTCQSKTLFEQQLLVWAKSQSLVFLDQLSSARLREFRASWKNGALTTHAEASQAERIFQLLYRERMVDQKPLEENESGARDLRSHGLLHAS
jgi:integrase/recombinase XerD